MKSSLRPAAVVFFLVLGTAVFAADKPADKKDVPKADSCACCKDGKDCKDKDCKCEKCAEKPKLVMLTGSRIPQRITKQGRITDGINPVTVFTSEDLAATGETDLAAALRKLHPSIR